jgi:hypothetical protein
MGKMERNQARSQKAKKLKKKAVSLKKLWLNRKIKS